MERSVIKTRQIMTREICVQVTDSLVSAVTAGTGGVIEGTNEVTAFKNGTGDYTISFAGQSRRAMHVKGYIALTANLQASIVSVSSSAVRIAFTNNSGTATNTDFHLTLQVFGKSGQI